MKCFQIVFATTLFAASFATAQQTSAYDPQLKGNGVVCAISIFDLLPMH